MGFIVVGITLVALRTPGQWSNPAFYAEDGQIFFSQQLQSGVSSLFQPYNGYFHLVPRLIALLASPAPAFYQPLVFAACSAVLQTLAASFFLLRGNRVLVHSDAIRIAAAFITLTDFESYEMLNNALNAQWFIAPVAILILCQVGLIDAALSRLRIVVFTLLIALIGMSAPMLLLASPFAIYVLFRVRRLQKIIPATFLITCAAQGLVFSITSKSGSSSSGLPPLSPPEIVRLILGTAGSWTYRDILPMTVGFPQAQYLASRYGELIPILIFVVLLCASVRLWDRRPNAKSVFLICWVTMSVVLVGFSLFARNLIPFVADPLTFAFFHGGQRYFAIPGWMFLVAMAIILDLHLPGRYPLIGAMALLSIFGIGAISNYKGQVFPDRNWRASSEAIENWRRRPSFILRSQHLVVPIVPNGWMIDLPPR
jgi:hypothetical protein